MILDERDRIRRLFLSQRSSKHRPQVWSLSNGQVCDLANKRHIEQRHAVVHPPDVFHQNVHVVSPILSHQEPVAADGAIQVGDEIPQESLREMLYGIEADARELDLVPQPFAPAEDIVPDFRMGIVHICEHAAKKKRLVIRGRSRGE